MSSHRPRSGSASATPVPTPSPQPPPSEEESSSSQPSTSSRSRGAHSSQSHSHSRRSHQLGRHRTTPLAEEQPGLEVYYPQSSSPPPAAASPDVRVGRTRTRVAPSFWSKEVADNPSQFTFYRDPTPTPPEKREREKAGDYVGSPLPTQRPGRSSTVALETALTIPPPDTRRRPPRNDTICGLGRSMFFLAVAAVVLLVLGIAVGVGVGVGAGKKSIQSSQPAAASSSSSTPTTTATSPTSSTTQISSPSSSTTGSSASPIPTAVTDCPFINNTIYQVPGSSKSFLRLCGIDYSGDSEAVELDNKPTLTFADCMGNCAGTYGCVGCSWGIDPEDPSADHQCWMKGELKSGGHTVASDRCFAILQQ